MQTEDRLIWASDAKRAIEHIDPAFSYIINHVPTAERTYGQWIYDSGSGKYFCSACDEYPIYFKKDTLYGGDLYEVCLTDYCPHCGADMRGY